MEKLKAVAVGGVTCSFEGGGDGVPRQPRRLRTHILVVPPARLHALQARSLFANCGGSVVTHPKYLRIKLRPPKLMDKMERFFEGFAF